MLRKITAAFFSALLVYAQSAVAQNAAVLQRVMVRKGTVFRLNNVEPIDPATAQRGDKVPLRVADPVIVDGVTVLAAGTLVYGMVREVKRTSPKNPRFTGSVHWTLDEVEFSDSSSGRARVDGILRAVPDGADNPRFAVYDDRNRWVGELEEIEHPAPKVKEPHRGHKVLANIGLGILFAPLVVVAPELIMGVALGDKLDDRNEPASSGLGRVEANSTMIVRVTRDHRVRR
jgi:hypothetical protein